MGIHIKEKIRSKDEDGSRLQGAGAILHLVHAPGGAEQIVRFYKEQDERPEDDINHLEFLEMSRELWEDFDEPTVITVTVTPGDQYNS